MTYYPLPTYQPGNRLLDFSPIERGIASYRDGMDRQAEREQNIAIGNSLAKKDYGGAAAAAYGQGRLDVGMGIDKARMSQEEAARQRERQNIEYFGAKAKAVMMEQNPQRRAAMWQSIVSRHPDRASLTPDYLDPMKGPELVAAEAGQYIDQLERRYKEAQINKLNRDAQGIGETPANVREWQYFSRLSPDEQQRYLTMRRAEKYLDTGTEFVRPNSMQPTGAPVATIPKDVAGKEFQQEFGTARGKAAAAAPGDVNAADDALKILQSIRSDKGIDIGTGFTSLGNRIPGTPGYDFQNKVNQASSGAFLSAIQQLRGMGALSNAEGQTATQAVTRMNTASSKEAFLAAVADYEAVIMRGRDQALRRMQGGPVQVPPQSQPVPPPAGALSPGEYVWDGEKLVPKGR